MAENNELSEREVEILQLVATGASNKEIANQLYISTNTVKVHLRNIFSKIGVSSRTEAAMYAVQNGLVQSVGEDHQELSGQLPIPEGSPGMRSRFLRYGALVIIGLILVAGSIIVTYLLREPITSGSTQTEIAAEINRWQVQSGLPTARQGLAVTAFENAIYAIAGESPEGVTGLTEIYNPETDSWAAGNPKPIPVVDAQAIVLGGKIHIPGGRLASGEVTNILEIYNPRTDEWERGTEMPIGISAYAMASFEGKLYLFGGWGGSNYLSSVFEYNPITNSWSELTNMRTERAYAGAVVAGGKIFVIGGKNNQSPLSINEVYSPEFDHEGMDPWSEAAPIPDPRYALGVTNIVDNIYLIGGAHDSSEADYSYIYLPVSNSWQELQHPFSHNWTHFGQVLLGMRMYLIGGEIEETPSNQNISYQAIFTLSIPVVSKSEE